MEVAGAALGIAGAVGVLGQLLDGCLKAYRIFTTASDLGRDSERLVCKIRIEETRLMVWGRELGVSEGQFERNLAYTHGASGGQHDALKSLAEMILRELYRTVMDLNKLQDRYGLSVDKAAYKANADPNNIVPSSPSPSASEKSKTGPGGVRLRARWVIQDKDKFGVFLDDLQFYNDRLEKLFPPARIATLQRTWTNELLQSAQRDLSKLDILESASQGAYPGLSTFANLKRLQINLDAAVPSRKILSSSELKIPRWRIKEYIDDPAQMTRCRGIYQKPTDTLKGSSVSEDVNVFVEWTAFDPNMDMEQRCQIYQNVDNLARMLHSSSNRHPDLHTLDCVGYVEDTQRHRYGMVYLSVPPSAASSAGNDTQSNLVSISSLANLIISTPTPFLDMRFNLAHTVAVALWSCHTLDWLHKTLCPHNILFFHNHTEQLPVRPKSQDKLQVPAKKREPPSPLSSSAEDLPPSPGPTSNGSNTASTGTSPSNSSSVDITSPYLAGFDSSRPDHIEEMSTAPRNLQGEEIYRHPDSLGQQRLKYRKGFDIYSLGLLLLEIGLWKSLETFHRGKYSKYSPAAFREKIVMALVPLLGAKTGRRYMEVVGKCLSYEEPDEKSQQGWKPDKVGPHQMMDWVVQTLEGLQV